MRLFRRSVRSGPRSPGPVPGLLLTTGAEGTRRRLPVGVQESLPCTDGPALGGCPLTNLSWWVSSNGARMVTRMVIEWWVSTDEPSTDEPESGPVGVH